MNNQIKSQRKATVHTKVEKATTRMLELCEKRITVGLCITRFKCTLETRCRKSWNQFKGYDSLSQRYVMRVSGKIKDHRWGKINVKISRQRSPYAMKFEDRSHEETERQHRCARSMAWKLAKNIYKIKEKARATFFSPLKKWVLPSASSRESCEREFEVDSGASMHMSARKTTTLLSWRP